MTGALTLLFYWLWIGLGFFVWHLPRVMENLDWRKRHDLTIQRGWFIIGVIIVTMCGPINFWLDYRFNKDNGR